MSELKMKWEERTDVKKTVNIEDIELWENNPKQYNDSKIVRVLFKFPCKWTTLTIDELKEILRLWIKTEEIRYPKENGFLGRDLLFEEIKDVFENDI